MLTQKNKAKILMVLAFLASMSSELSANTVRLINQKKINPRDRALVVRTTVAAGGTVNLLDGFNSSIRGINDFNGNQLANNINFVLDSLTVNYGTGATDTVGSKYDIVDYTTALPPALRNANLIISQEDKVIRKIPISLINEAKSSDARLLELGGFALLKSEAITSLEIEFGQNADFGLAADTSPYVELILNGFETATTY